MNIDKNRNVPWQLCMALALATAGCTGESNVDDGHVSAVQNPIANGVVTNALGVVDFTLPDIPGNPIPPSCTGSMIAPNMVLTAAHCFKLALQGLTAHQTSGSFPTTISYYDPAFGRRPVFDSAVDGNATWRARDYHYDADFPGDANDDIGVVIIPGTFHDTDYHDYKRLFDDVDGPLNGTLLAYGAGIFTWGGQMDDLLRSANFAVENVAPEHIITDNQREQTCGGDSGGPLIKKAGSVELVAGILSMHEGNPDSDFCADDNPYLFTTGGDNSAWLKVSHNLSWLQNTAGLTCDRLSTSGLFYRRCFALPFIEDLAFEGLSRETETAIAMTVL